METSSRLGDYALIGNCRSAALVNKYGSIDWCCLPEFHSPAVFSALLDKERGGYFSIAPTGRFHSFQKYIDDTMALETELGNKRRALKKSGRNLIFNSEI